MTYLAGTTITASGLNDLLNKYVQKALATARNSTTTVTADPDLVVALPANSSWHFVYTLYTSSAANAAGDFRVAVGFPTGASCSYSAHGLANTLASGTTADLSGGGTTRLDTTSPGSEMIFGCSLSGQLVTLVGDIDIGSTAGNLSLLWAQETSNANDTSLLEGSSVIAYRTA